MLCYSQCRTNIDRSVLLDYYVCNRYVSRTARDTRYRCRDGVVLFGPIQRYRRRCPKFVLPFVYTENNIVGADCGGGGDGDDADMQIEYPYLIVVVNFVLVINSLFCYSIDGLDYVCAYLCEKVKKKFKREN